MAKYTLTYFNIPGIAEPIRFIFAYAKVPFNDNTINIADWPGWLQQKSKFPWGNLPVLEEDGNTMSQSFAIARYLAKKHNLYGKDDWEAGKIDEYVDAVKDFYMQVLPIFFTEEEAKKEEIKGQVIKMGIPRTLPKFNADLQGRKYLVGDTVSWADFVLAHYMEMMGELLGKKNFLDEFPAVKAHRDVIYNIPEIKAWIAKRPVPQQPL